MGRPIRYACRDHALVLIKLLLPLCIVVTSACALSPSPQASSTHAPLRSPTTASGPLGQITLFPLPPAVPAVNRFAIAPDGTLWLTAFNVAPSSNLAGGIPIEDAIVRFTPPDFSVPSGAPGATNGTVLATGSFTTYPLPTPTVWPDGITPGSDGAIWFTEYFGNAIGRLDPLAHITEFFVPPRPVRATGETAESQPHDIVAGPDGNLWFDDSGGNKIGRITPRGDLTEFPIPAHPENPNGSGPFGMTVGPDGAVWFTELMGMRIGRITMNGHITEYKLPGVNHVPRDIVAGRDGTLWFTESTQNLLGRITVDGRITEYPLLHTPCNTAGATGPSATGVCVVGDLVAGPDGGVWFTEGWRDALGRINESGYITEFPAPRLSNTESGMPQQLALGSDCALWFTYGEGIGRAQPFSTAPGCPQLEH